MNDIGLKTIAKNMSFSMTTISHVVKDAFDIGLNTKCKVLNELISCCYIPLDVIKSLEKRKGNRICVIVDSMISPFFGMIIETFIKELKKDNLEVIVYPIGPGVVNAQTINNLINGNVDGFISFLLLDELAYLRSRLFQLPGIIFGRKQELEGVSCIYMDDFQGGSLAADYLVKNSPYKKYMYVGNDTIECNERRYKGFASRLNELGIEDVKYLNYTEIKDSLDKCLKEGYKSIFAFDDPLATQIYKVSKEDIKVVGFNGTSKFYSNYLSYPSIDSDYNAMVLVAISVIKENIKDHLYKPVKIKFETKLEE